MITVNLKTLSQNEAWQGRRFKSDKYKAFEKAAMFMLPKFKLPEPPYRIVYEFGFSNMGADIDNPIKSLTDILSKKYGFNDNQIHKAEISKVKTEKGKEYFAFKIETI